MNRKISLSPVAGQILFLLEVAGEENVASLKATLGVDDDAFAAAIQMLERLRLITLVIESSGRPSLVLTQAGRQSLFR